jgi:hypothetical protein
MAQHVVIRREEYVAGTSDGPEPVVFTQTNVSRRPIPFGRIKIGETVWMKWSGGPIVANAIVEGFRLIEGCTPDQLRETVKGTALYRHYAYWDSRLPIFYGMTIYLSNSRWLDRLIKPIARSYGSGWVILDTKQKEETWLSQFLDQVEKSLEDRAAKSLRSLAKSIRFEVLRRDSFTCTYCGRQPPEVKLQVDHVVPWSKGGTHELSNLRTACRDCNLGKSDRLL